MRRYSPDALGGPLSTRDAPAGWLSMLASWDIPEEVWNNDDETAAGLARIGALNAWSVAQLEPVAAGACAHDPAQWASVARATEAACMQAGMTASSRLVRLRFLLLSEPVQPEAVVSTSAAQATFGSGWRDRHEEAAAQWAIRLTNFEDDPWMSAWSPERLENEVELLLGGAPTHPAWAGGDWTNRIVGKLVLPRYALATACRHSWRTRQAQVMVAAMIACGLVAGCFLAFGHPARAGGAFALMYLAAVAGAVVAGVGVLYPICLRMPAAGVIAQLALFTSSSWFDHLGGRPWLLMALAASSFGYLAIEARAHTRSGKTALIRAAGAWTLGVAHGIAVGVIALVVAGPVFIARFVFPTGFRSWAPLVGFNALAGLAAGVFLQILWEDRPITSPLGRISWGST